MDAGPTEKRDFTCLWFLAVLTPYSWEYHPNDFKISETLHLILIPTICKNTNLWRIFEALALLKRTFLSSWKENVGYFLANKLKLVLTQHLWGEWPSGLRCCDKNRKVPDSNPIMHLAGLRNPTSLWGSRWPLGRNS